MDYSKLPALNAFLNSASAILLLTGYILIRRRAITAHKIAMLAAFLTSMAFLTSYLIYHYHHHSTPFWGKGTLRLIYFVILISHTILAIVNLPLVLRTLFLGLSGKFDKHMKIARITFPIWLYVSVTGVVVYWMLYRLKL